MGTSCGRPRFEVRAARLAAMVTVALSAWFMASAVALAQACPQFAQSGCLIASKSRMSLLDQPGQEKDQLLWKWSQGQHVSQTVLADPTQSSEFSLCIYAGTAETLIGDVRIPAGPPWKKLGEKGYGFKGAAPSGASFVLLKAGDSGQASATVKGRGPGLPDGLVPITG